MQPLSARLDELLEAMWDREFAGKLRNVYQQAVHTISRLSELDLLKYETSIAEDSAGLSLWEEMAPVIRDTVADVNALLMAIHEQFPLSLPGVPSRGAPVPVDRRAQRAILSLHAASELLAKEITHLGERMRSPSVVSDRWNLLAVLQASRGGFREQIGNLLHMSASAFGPISRQDAVPGHRDEVRSAVLIRAAVADLVQLLAASVERIRQADASDVQWYAQHLQREMDTLARTPAYKALRAQDKRALVEFRGEIGALAAPGTPQPWLLALAERFLKFAMSLRQVNDREVLVRHDRDVWAACGAQIEEAAGLLESDPPKAAARLAAAGRAAQALYGRDAELDQFLREIRRRPLAQLTGPELKNSLEKFRELVANAPVF